MPRCFTYCFNRNGAGELAELAGQPLTRIWGRRFAGLDVGDRIYIISVQSGRLHLYCRLIVGRVDLNHGWIDASDSTLVAPSRVVSPESTNRLLFVGRKEPASPRLRKGGLLDPQTLRGIRQLTDAGAFELDQWLVQDIPSGDTVARPMRALSVRQPWAELILRGIKSIEVRSQATNVRERVYLYASRIGPGVDSTTARRYSIDAENLPRGVLVGTVEVENCRPLTARDGKRACISTSQLEGFAWELKAPQRAAVLLAPRRRPQPIWFYPFHEPPAAERRRSR